MNKNDFLCSFRNGFKPVPHAGLTCRPARDPGQQPRRDALGQSGDGGFVKGRIVGVDGYEKPRCGQGVREGGKRPGKDGNAAQQAILLRNFAAEARATASGDNEDERIGAGLRGHGVSIRRFRASVNFAAPGMINIKPSPWRSAI